MKLLSGKQFLEMEKNYISDTGITEIELMEYAATRMKEFILKHELCMRKIVVWCGSGNNAGDGYTLARFLLPAVSQVVVVDVSLGNELSLNCAIQAQKYEKNGGDVLAFDDDLLDRLPSNEEEVLHIDAILGIGLNRPIGDEVAKVFDTFNSLKGKKISIDIPSGMFTDFQPKGFENRIILSEFTLTIEQPKLSFLLPISGSYVPDFEILSLGMPTTLRDSMVCPYHFIVLEKVKKLVPKRKKFSHKGSYGHCLMIGGAKGMAGAVIMAAMASLRSGAGLSTVMCDDANHGMVVTCCPVLMTSSMNYHNCSDHELKKYSIAIGMGLGQSDSAIQTMRAVLQTQNQPIVIDADGINILAKYPEWYDMIPAYSIITPHYKEFERLVGITTSDEDRLMKQIEFSKKYQVCMIYKGAHSAVSLPNGQVYFNVSGNSGMATAGSGDVLSGILCGLLAQGLGPKNACIFGVYLHGLSGDLAAKDRTKASVIATDLIEYIGNAYKHIDDFKSPHSYF